MLCALTLFAVSTECSVLSVTAILPIFSLAINKVSAVADIRKPNNCQGDGVIFILQSAETNDKMLDALALERALLPPIHIYFDFSAKQQR